MSESSRSVLEQSPVGSGVGTEQGGKVGPDGQVEVNVRDLFRGACLEAVTNQSESSSEMTCGSDLLVFVSSSPLKNQRQVRCDQDIRYFDAFQTKKKPSP